MSEDSEAEIGLGLQSSLTQPSRLMLLLLHNGDLFLLLHLVVVGLLLLEFRWEHLPEHVSQDFFFMSSYFIEKVHTRLTYSRFVEIYGERITI